MTGTVTGNTTTELMRLVEQIHQRVVDLEQRQAEINDELATERAMRRALTQRLDRMEYRS